MVFSTKMDKSDALTVQRSMALLPLIPQFLSKNSKTNPNVLSAIYLIGMNKLGKKIFELKCIPMEKFEDLLRKNSRKTRFIGDIKSCGLLSLNSLAALPATNKSWLKLQKLKDCDIKEETTSQALLENEKFYLIQCYAVCSVEKDLTLYVTNEKFFNILNYFDVCRYSGPDFKVWAGPYENAGFAELAKHVTLGLIHAKFEIDLKDLQEIVDYFFEEPRLLKKNEIVSINVRDAMTHCSFDYLRLDNIFFQVLNIVGSTSEGSDNFGYYVSTKHSSISIMTKVTNCQGFFPPIHTKYIKVKERIGYEIPICPAGLRKYFEQLESLMKVFLTSGDLKFKPMVLLIGVKGSGKKTVVNCLASKFGMKIINIDCFDFIGHEGSGLESKLKILMAKLKDLAPCILLLENIELLGRDEQYRVSISVIDAFQRQIEELYREKLNYPVITIALTSQKVPEIISLVERMFIRTIVFEAMKKDDIYQQLTWLVHEAGMTCFSEVLRTVAEKVNGYRFADLAKLVRLTLKFQREDPKNAKETNNVKSLLLTLEHFDNSIKIMDALYSDSIGSAKVPCVHWDDVGGLDHLKEEIILALDLPTKHPELMSGLRASGFLFYGPPGTGKTLMAKAVATEFNYNFLAVKGPELFNMYVGQSEKNVREVFQRARDAAPCIIFFDEFDSLAPNRGSSSSSVTDRIVSQLLTEMDGLESNKGVFIIGATNRPDLVDPALLRPGRFDKMFYVGVCETFDSKLSVLKALTRKFLLDNVDLEAVVKQLPRQVSGADVYSICSNAWLEAARRHIKVKNEGKEVELPVRVTSADFGQALKVFVPSLTPDILSRYERFKNLE